MGKLPITTKKFSVIVVGILAIVLVIILSVNADNYNNDTMDNKEIPIPVESKDSPCEEGYYLAGDICDKMPPGYVETRNECEMGVDSMEAAGVKQDYQLELEKCR